MTYVGFGSDLFGSDLFSADSKEKESHVQDLAGLIHVGSRG